MRNLLTCFIVTLSIITNGYGQITFTSEELLLLAKHNVERLYLKDLTKLQSQEIDSLYYKVELLQESFHLCDANQITLNEIIFKLNEVDEKRQEQKEILEEKIRFDAKTIKNQNRKLNAWRIATPIITIGAFITALFIN